MMTHACSCQPAGRNGLIINEELCDGGKRCLTLPQTGSFFPALFFFHPIRHSVFQALLSCADFDPSVSKKRERDESTAGGSRCRSSNDPPLLMSSRKVLAGNGWIYYLLDGP